MIFEVEAPTDLECGYPLEVDINGMILAVPVPYNVRAGELIRFEYDDPLPKETPLELSQSRPETAQGDLLAPHGRWRYELCDCCNLCCVSGLWWNSCCPIFIVWAQLLTRMRLGPWANPASPECVNSTFAIVVGMYILRWLLCIMFVVIVGVKYNCRTWYETYGNYVYEYYECSYTGNQWGIVIPCFVLGSFYTVYPLVMLTRLRGYFRRTYQIPGSCCGDGCCDDFCCMYWCGCCNTIQMARHTHDEHVYKYQCCNTTGLPPDAPQII